MKLKVIPLRSISILYIIYPFSLTPFLYNKDEIKIADTIELNPNNDTFSEKVKKLSSELPHQPTSPVEDDDKFPTRLHAELNTALSHLESLFSLYPKFASHVRNRWLSQNKFQITEVSLYNDLKSALIQAENNMEFVARIMRKLNATRQRDKYNNKRNNIVAKFFHIAFQRQQELKPFKQKRFEPQEKLYENPLYGQTTRKYTKLQDPVSQQTAHSNPIYDLSNDPQPETEEQVKNHHNENMPSPNPPSYDEVSKEDLSSVYLFEKTEPESQSDHYSESYLEAIPYSSAGRTQTENYQLDDNNHSETYNKQELPDLNDQDYKTDYIDEYSEAEEEADESDRIMHKENRFNGVSTGYYIECPTEGKILENCNEACKVPFLLIVVEEGKKSNKDWKRFRNNVLRMLRNLKKLMEEDDVDMRKEKRKILKYIRPTVNKIWGN